MVESMIAMDATITLHIDYDMVFGVRQDCDIQLWEYSNRPPGDYVWRDANSIQGRLEFTPWLGSDGKPVGQLVDQWQDMAQVWIDSRLLGFSVPFQLRADFRGRQAEAKCPSTGNSYEFTDHARGLYPWVYLYQVWRAISSCGGSMKEGVAAVIAGPGVCLSFPAVGEGGVGLPWPSLGHLPPDMAPNPAPPTWIGSPG